MANIGTKNGKWQGARFCEEAGEGQDQERDGKCHDAAQRVERAKREKCLSISHADAGGLAETPPKRLGQHKGKVHDNGRTGVVKRRVQAPVQPNACKRRHGACGGKRVGKPPFTDINHRTGKGADPKGNIDH